MSTLTTANPQLFAKDLGIPDAQVDSFYSRLGQVAAFANKELGFKDGKHTFVTRDNIYKEFVELPHKDVGDKKKTRLFGQLDPNKPFAAAIRALVDLKYNCNLPDALSRYAVTSEGDIDRTVLQDEPRRTSGEALTLDDEDAIVDFISRGAFDELNTFNLFHFLGRMTLGDIVDLRKSSEWAGYIGLVRDLMPAQNGMQFGSHKILQDSFRRELSLSHTSLMKLACERVISRDVLEDTLGWWDIVVTLTGTGVKFISRSIHGMPEIEIPENVPDIFASAGKGILIELTFNVREGETERRCIRKYPIFQKRVKYPNTVFERVLKNIELESRRGRVAIAQLSEKDSRENDRQNTINLPEPEL